MKQIDKTKLGIFIIIRASVMIAGSIALFNRNWEYVGMAVLTLIVMLLPSIIEKRFKLEIPDGFEIILILFIYAAIFWEACTNSILGFGGGIKMLHSLSG